MIQRHVGVKQKKIGETVGALHSFAWNYVKYANMEGFRWDSHIYVYNKLHSTLVHVQHLCNQHTGDSPIH